MNYKLMTTAVSAALLGAAPALADSDHISNKQLGSAPLPQPLSFDRSIQSLVINGVISPDEARDWELHNRRPGYAKQKACRSGALSPQECGAAAQVRSKQRLLADSEVIWVEIKPTQSLMSLVREHGMTLTELAALNPDIELSKLVVGSRVRVRNPSHGNTESWPELPGLPGAYTAPDSVQKQQIRERIERQREQERIAAARRADALRVARLRREEERRQRYRLIGTCTYDWHSWGKSSSGVRSVKTSGSCSGITEVAVDCKSTKISKLKWRKWQPWETPSGAFEDLVVESCANVLGASEPRYMPSPIIAPAPQPTDALQVNQTEPAVPVCTGPTIICGLP